MTDLVITAANVIAQSNAAKSQGVAGASVTAGQVVYLDSATNTLKLADTNGGSSAIRTPAGIALHAAAAGQPLSIQTGGDIAIGATVAAGTIYCLSATAGGICPAADLTTGDHPFVLGIAISASQIRLIMQGPDIALG